MLIFFVFCFSSSSPLISSFCLFYAFPSSKSVLVVISVLLFYLFTILVNLWCDVCFRSSRQQSDVQNVDTQVWVWAKHTMLWKLDSGRERRCTYTKLIVTFSRFNIYVWHHTSQSRAYHYLSILSLSDYKHRESLNKSHWCTVAIQCNACYADYCVMLLFPFWCATLCGDACSGHYLMTCFLFVFVLFSTFTLFYIFCLLFFFNFNENN